MYDIQYALKVVLELIEPMTSVRPDTMKVSTTILLRTADC